MSGVGTAIGISAGIGALGSVASGAIGSSAAKDAASQQTDAANRAADLQYKASQDALDFQKQQYNTSQQQLAPWLNTGTGALSQLSYLLGVTPQSTGASATPPNTSPYQFGDANGQSSPTLNVPVINAPSSPTRSMDGTPTGTLSLPTGTAVANPAASIPSGSFGSLNSSYPGGQFVAPTAADMATSDPGYQARLALGTQALQQSAAARGNVLTGGTAQSLNQLAQDYASNEYNNTFNRAYNTYATNYNQFQNQQNNTYNRLASLAGIGQTTANNLATLGSNTANSVSNTLTNTANSMGNSYQNAAAANASGIVGSANAWNGALSSGTNGISNILLLQKMLGGSGSGGYSYSPLTQGYNGNYGVD